MESGELCVMTSGVPMTLLLYAGSLVTIPVVRSYIYIYSKNYYIYIIVYVLYMHEALITF